MNQDALKLSVYFGERARTGDRFLADALIAVFARHELEASILLRGVEGFGATHTMRTDRLLSLSEDLPVVAVAVDTRPRIEAALDDVSRLGFSGLVTVERARMVTGRIGAVELPEDLHEATKLTVYLGRHERAADRSAAEAVVDLLRDAGVAGATVLLGVDGTAHGVRERARFFARNASVPLMILSVGDGRSIAAALPGLEALLERPVVTLERVRVCKRDGERLAEPRALPMVDSTGLAFWQKLIVVLREDAQHDGRPIHAELVRRLRRSGAAGATSLRGIWGYHGRHAPHGDGLWQLRRRVPIVTVVVDRPDRTRDWFELIDEVTGEAGLVTSEAVPAFRATAAGAASGGLRLAERIA